MTRILVVDNYDSFVFNLVRYLAQLGAEAPSCATTRCAGRRRADYDGVLVSPGPGTPEDGRRLRGDGPGVRRPRPPMLGVCLGHQAIAVAYGATVDRAPELLHGKTSLVEHDGDGRARRAARPVHGDALPLARGRRRRRCPTSSRSPAHGVRASSWRCGTATLPSRACSSTPSRCSPRAATACSPTGSRVRRRRTPWPARPASRPLVRRARLSPGASRPARRSGDAVAGRSGVGRPGSCRRSPSRGGSGVDGGESGPSSALAPAVAPAPWSW